VYRRCATIAAPAVACMHIDAAMAVTEATEPITLPATKTTWKTGDAWLAFWKVFRKSMNVAWSMPAISSTGA